MRHFLIALALSWGLISCSSEGAVSEEGPVSIFPPVDVTATNVTATSVVLSWSILTNMTNTDTYRIYQDGVEIAEVSETSSTVVGLEPETTYVFTVSALDGTGNESEQSVAVTVTTLPVATSGVPKVLVFTKTSGFDHNTRAEAMAMVQQFGMQQNFEVVVDDTGAEFDSAENLAEYSVIFFTNTSGNTLEQNQRDNVEGYAAQGGHFISNHAASDGYGHSTATTVNGGGKGVWDWYAENVTGCSVRNGPNHTAANFPATVNIQNDNVSLTENVEFPWNDEEEWYYWEGGYLNTEFQELLRVESTGTQSFDVPRMTAQYLERPDGGMSFYTSMGHARNKYSDSQFMQLLSNAFALLLQ